MEIDILSLFPEYFIGPLGTSILGKAVSKGILKIRTVNLRDFGLGKWKQVDDVPYGGDGGMLLMPQPVIDSIRSVKRKDSHIIYLSPQGSRLTAKKSRDMTKHSHIILLCGHYEGLDERVIESEVDEEISIGDYVLTSGCPAALVLIDAISRFIPGVLGNDESADNDSLENNLLEWPQYTRPRVFEDNAVPDVLLSGNHKDIKSWKIRQQILRTLKKRPDLYFDYQNSFFDMGMKRKDSSVSSALMNLDIMLSVRNMKKSYTFYSKVFGDNNGNIADGIARICILNSNNYLILNLSVEKNHEIENNIFSLALEDMETLEKFLFLWKKAGGKIIDNNTENTSTFLIKDPEGTCWMVRKIK